MNRTVRDGRPRTTATTAVGALLLVVALFFEGPAELERSLDGAAVRAHIEGNVAGLQGLVLAESLAVLGALLLVVGLRALARAGGADEVLLGLIGVGGSLTALWLWLQAAVDMVPLVMLDDAQRLGEYSDQTLLALDLVGRLGETFGDVGTIPRGLFLLGASLAAVTTGFLPRWLGWSGLVVGAASLVGVLGVSHGAVVGIGAWFVGLFGFLLWTAALAVVLVLRLLRTGRSATPGVTSGTAGEEPAQPR
jgi:hypothetical protein